MEFKTISEVRTIRSKDSFNRKWTGKIMLKASTAHNSYILKCVAKIDSSFGIGPDNFTLKYLNGGEWLRIADATDIENALFEDHDMNNYDSINEAFDSWVAVCLKYVPKIVIGL